MHAYSFVSLGVGQCAANEVVQFFVWCGTCVLSVGLSFFSTCTWFFSNHFSFDALVSNFSFKLLFRRLKFEHTQAPVYVWVSVRVCGRKGVLVSRCFFLLILVCLRLFQQHAAQCHLHWSQHDMIGSLRRLFSFFGDFLRIRHVPWSRS